MMRKRLDVKDSANQESKSYKTLRIWISNTAENQPWQARGLDENAFDFSTGMEATYRVKIEGKLLDDKESEQDKDKDSDDDEDPEEEGEKNDPDAMEHDLEIGASKHKVVTTLQTRKKFSHFFKSITVDFDRNKSIQPDAASTIEWKKPAIPPNTPNPPSSADFDCIEFERKSDENINCTINMVRDETPERYRLSKELSELLDVQEATRGEIITGIWDYVRALGLQEDDEKRGVRCDERLRAVRPPSSLVTPLTS